jgi:hypothetical protein
LFPQWWGRGRGPVGQMPHHSMVLKNALTGGNGYKLAEVFALCVCLETQTRNKCQILFKNSLIIHEENTKKNHKCVESLFAIEISLDLHKL